MAATPPPLAVPQIRTFTYAVNKVSQRFGKDDPRLRAQLFDDVTDKLRQICAEYPYWFLNVEPGNRADSGFPYNPAPTAPATSGWIDRGWLVTTPGVERYPLLAQIDLSDEMALMAPSEASSINFAKRFSISGALECDLRVVRSDEYWSWGTNQGVASTGRLSGAPFLIFPDSVGRTTFIRLNPIPDDNYIMCISWNVAYPPWFSYRNCVTNCLMEYYPEVIECLVGLQYAEWFKETELLAMYQMRLYGEEMGRVRAGIKNHGVIGIMRNDTNNRFKQETGEVEWSHSARAAVGRGGAWARRPGDSYYISPNDYT